MCLLFENTCHLEIGNRDIEATGIVETNVPDHNNEEDNDLTSAIIIDSVPFQQPKVHQLYHYPTLGLQLETISPIIN